MTKEELKALVAAKIAGQGNQVDTGSVLPKVLDEIIDKAFEGGGGDLTDYVKKVEVDNFEEFDETTSYSEGDVVRKDGALSKFTHLHQGPWDPEHVEQTTLFDLLHDYAESIDERVSVLEFIPTVTISALETADMTAEQASAAGFTADVIAKLQAAHHPTIEFSDMCVTFNAVEVISEDLVNQSAIIVHTAVGGGTLYKAILSLKTDGSVTYTVTEIQ